MTEVKKYTPDFVVKYLYKNKDKYNKYFNSKIKNINYKIFFTDLSKDYIKYVREQSLSISFNPWDITDNKRIVYDKKYSKLHRNGWEISGVINQEYVSYVPVIFAYHKKYGYIFGNFSEEINVISYDPNKALHHLLNNNPPLIWTHYDI